MVWESGKSTGLKGGEPVFTHQVHRLAAFVATFRLRHARRLPGVRVWAEASDPGATAQKASPGQAATPLREGAHQRKYVSVLYRVGIRKPSRVGGAQV